MIRTRIFPEPEQFPECFRQLLSGCPVYDSSCSGEARVWFIDREEGFYLKTAPKGSLAREAAMTRYLQGKGLCPRVLAYESLEADWLLTARIPGEDCTHRMYLEDPRRLSALLGEQLRQLHSLDPALCPVPDRTGTYLENVRRNHALGRWDPGFFPHASREEAWKTVEETAPHLGRDTLLHGDYCLPNIMLDNWRFSGFLDVDCGGIGDRHLDLFWGVWTLEFNLHTNRWGDRFLDAYGRERIDEEVLRAIGAFEAFG